jgi:hypothetical protein
MAPYRRKAMNPSIRPLMTELSKLSKELNAASDELGAEALEIQSELKTLNCGVEAKVVFNGANEHGDHTPIELRYGKIKGDAWFIYIVVGVLGDEKWWKYGDAPRTYRLQARWYLKDLVANLVANVRTTILLFNGSKRKEKK